MDAKSSLSACDYFVYLHESNHRRVLHMSYIHPADRSQYVLMNSLDDLVHSDHPVRLIDAMISTIVENNPTQFPPETRGDVGRPEYSPSTLLKLYVYGYVNGVRSSRKLETETQRNIEVIWLLGKLSPDHWTISQYRKEHRDDITFVTKKFREFLRDIGYIKGHCVAIDGSKVKANARREMLTQEKLEKRLARIDTQLEEYLAQLAEADARDDVLEELDQMDKSSDGVSPPPERERHLVDKIAQLQQQLEELQHQKMLLEKSERTSISPTDSDAPLMKTRDGKVPAYNVQIAVDDAYHMIAVSEVITDQNDLAALPVMVSSLKENLGVVPAEIVADTGYYNPALIATVEQDTKTRCYIPPPSKTKTTTPVDTSSAESISFTYDAQSDRYTCSPAGRPLVLVGKNKRRRRGVADVYQGTECGTCHLREGCTRSTRGRTVHRYHDQQWRDKYKERMTTTIAKDIGSIRKTVVEHPFGWIKCLGGKIPLLLRGIINVTTEINLYTTAHNLKRLFNLESIERLFDLIKEYQWSKASA